MRSMSQGVRGETEVDLLQRSLDLEMVEFRFDGVPGCEKPPLSWDLSDQEKGCMDKVWESKGEARRKVAEFVRAAAQP